MNNWYSNPAVWLLPPIIAMLFCAVVVLVVAITSYPYHRDAHRMMLEAMYYAYKKNGGENAKKNQ